MQSGIFEAIFFTLNPFALKNSSYFSFYGTYGLYISWDNKL